MVKTKVKRKNNRERKEENKESDFKPREVQTQNEDFNAKHQEMSHLGHDSFI